MITLRPYQESALQDLWGWFERHDDGDPVVEASVGAGKSVMIAELCRRAIEAYPETRILMVVHVKELIEQNLAKLLQIWPSAPVGVYSASVGSRQLGRAITYATIGSVAKRAHPLGRVDLMLVDECFVAGTAVETIDGAVPIESISPGDVVRTAAGLGVVEAISERQSNDLYDIECDDGRVITCTGNHPFFTERGFVPARALERGANLFGVQAVHEMWKGDSTVQDDERGRLETTSVLLNLLLQETQEPDARRECATRNGASASGDWTSAEDEVGEWVPAHIDGTWTLVSVGRRLGVELPREDRHGTSVGIPESLQAGHQQHDVDGVHRGGRSISRLAAGPGPEETGPAGISRVARVTRHLGTGARAVFNLQVSGHPSYFAGGYLVHNCHLISSNESTMYRKLITELRRYYPAMRVIGWTGTAFRGDGIWLTQQGLFSHVAARVTMAELLAAGYLAPMVPAPVETKISTEDVATSGGDYVVSALARATDKAELVRKACAELVRLAADRRKWLVFAVTVEHAMHLAAELSQQHGIACAVVSAKTPKAERENMIRQFRQGTLRALVNVAVLTTGFDAPEVDCIALLRATKSPVLYVQIAGRGMRTADLKTDCLWLDFTDTTYTLGPVDAVKGRARPPERLNQSHEAPKRYCDACGNPSPAGVLQCGHCGAMFPEPERVTHFAEASVAPVISAGPQWISITRVTYRHNAGRDGKPDTLRVDYWSGIRVVASEWICLEHTGWARSKACAWWDKRGLQPAPTAIDDALERVHELREPARIMTRPVGKYTEIINQEWPAAQAAA